MVGWSCINTCGCICVYVFCTFRSIHTTTTSNLAWKRNILHDTATCHLSLKIKYCIYFDRCLINTRFLFIFDVSLHTQWYINNLSSIAVAFPTAEAAGDRSSWSASCPSVWGDTGSRAKPTSGSILAAHLFVSWWDFRQHVGIWWDMLVFVWFLKDL